MKKLLQIAQVQGSDEDGDQVVLKTAIKQVLEFFTLLVALIIVLEPGYN